MEIVFHVFLQTLFGSAGYFLAGSDAGVSTREAGSPLLQLLILSTAIVSAAIVFKSKHAQELTVQCKTLFGLCALAAISMMWSPDPMFTLRKAFALSVAMLFGIALVSRFGPDRALAVFVRSLFIACALSFVMVYVNPMRAIHQVADGIQLNHENLWRGVMGHKVSLGMLSGLSLAMSLQHGKLAFPWLGLRLLAIGIAAACLIGSGSATGIGLALIYVGIFWSAQRLVDLRPSVRDGLAKVMIVSFIVLGYLLSNGTLDNWATLLGKQNDLTGRANYWPHVANFIDQTRPILGFGYVAGYRTVGPFVAASSGIEMFEAHNGYLELVVAFGRLGSAIVIAAYLWWFVRALNLVQVASPYSRDVSLFPMAAIGTLLMVSYVESIILMPTGIWTVLFPLAVAVTARLRMDEVQADALYDELHDGEDNLDHEPSAGYRPV